MDDIQAKLVEMKAAHPQCLENRQKLKAVLSDYLPSNKREANLLLSAFDEDIVSKLSIRQDVTLTAIRFVKVLQNECGMTPVASIWAVKSWCYIMDLHEVAEAIQSIMPDVTPMATHNNQTVSGGTQHLDYGIYLVGSDFPAGNIKLVSEYSKQNIDIYYAIIKSGSVKNEIIVNGFFKTQVHLSVENGQRLEVRGKVQLICL